MNARRATDTFIRWAIIVAIVMGSFVVATAAAPTDPSRAFAVLSTAPLHGVTPIRHVAENPMAVVAHSVARFAADADAQEVAAYGVGACSVLLGILSRPLRI